MDKAHDGHGVANQMAKLVTRKDPTKPGQVPARV
jgi:hypothetical protein